MVTRAKNGIGKPKVFTVTSLPSGSFLPTCYTQAFKHKHWQNAMVEEFNVVVAANTWTLVPFHSSMKPVGCTWIFCNKENPDGTVSRHKARLMAKGYHQQYGIDFFETFSPVAKPQTILLLLTLAIISLGKSLNLTFPMPFFLAIFKKKFICVNHLASLITLNPIIFVSSTNLSMGSSKPPVPGIVLL